MIIAHLALFLASLAIIWFFGGKLVDSINGLAHRLHQSSFRLAFFVLGIITSITEFSVMANATLGGVPQVSAGNLIGSSAVIFLLVIPFLAIRGGGIRLAHTLTSKQLVVALIAIFLPALLSIDGIVTPNDGLLCLLAYATLIYLMHPRFMAAKPVVPEPDRPLDTTPLGSFSAVAIDILRVVGGGVMIFLAARILIGETSFFSEFLGIPGSFIGLLVLSVGTNIPEIVIAVRAIQKKHSEIAFGNYLGSALTNTPLFGLLALMNGRFFVNAPEFVGTALIAFAGYAAFYAFSRSKNFISRSEGIILAALYGLFVTFQMYVVAG